MADRYWVGGTGNWDTTTTHWSTSSGGAAGASVPTAADNVYFDANSGGGIVTVSSSNRLCLNLSFRGLSGTSDFTGTFAQSGTGAVTPSGGLILSASTTYTYTANITFLATSGSYNITCNGATFSGGMVFNGAGGTWSTTDVFRVAGVVVLTLGSLNLVYDSYMGAISSNNANVRSLSFGTGSNIVNLYLTGTGTLASFATTTNLTMFAAFNCYITDSSATAKSLSYNTVFQNNNDVYLGGSGSGSITFVPGTTGLPHVYVTNTGGAPISFSTGSISSLVWQAGTNAIWTNAASQTLTIGSDLVLTSSMGTPTLTPSIIFSLATTPLNGTVSTFVTANKTFVTGIITVNDIGGAFALQVTGDINSNANFTITATTWGVYVNGNINLSLVTNTLTLTAGRLDIQSGKNVTCGLFSSANTNTRTLNMGSGTWTLTGTGTVWNLATSTNMTLNAGQSRILINNTASPTIGAGFSGGGLTYYTVEYARGAATATNTINGSNTYANFIDNTSTVAHSYSWVSGTTHTFYKFNVRGSAGALISILRSAATTVNFVKVGQGIVSGCDYVSANSATTATPANTWYLGANGSSGGGGWILGDAPSSQSLLGAGGVG